MFIVMFSLLCVPGVYAADVPVQQGLVVDEAGLLTASEASAITKAAEGPLYTFHILILDSLNGANSTSYATNVYRSWGLVSRDILVLISSEDHQVEFNFNNPGLQSSLDIWSQKQGGNVGSSAITALLDTYFIPYAKDGDFAGGIFSLMEAAQSLNQLQGTVNGSVDTGTAGTAGTGTNSGVSGGSGSTGSTGSTGSGSNAGTSNLQGTSPENGSTYSMTTILLVLVGAAIILGLLYVLISGIRRRKALDEQKDQLGDLLVQANRAIESLKPFQGIVQGKTAERVEAISERLSNQLIQISSLRTEGNEAAPAWYRLGALRNEVEKLRETNKTFRTTLLEEEKQIAVISDADKNVKQRITELQEDTPELNQQLLTAVKETGYELREIAEDLTVLAEETSKADQLELFDPIAAQEITEDAHKKQDQIEKDLKDVDTFDDKVKNFPEVLSTARTQIAGIIAQNSLQNMKVKPYDNLEKASVEATNLEAPLRIGDMDEVRKIGGRLDILLQDAVAMTERQALIRQNNKRDLETVRSNWNKQTQRREELQSRISESRTRYVEHHLVALRDDLEVWSQRLREGSAEVPQIESWTSDERGEYDNAREALDRLLSLQEEAVQQFNTIDGSLDSLNGRLDKVNRIFSEGQDRVDSVEQLLRSRGLSFRSHFNLSSMSEFTELQHKLTAPPYNLDELEALAHSYQVQIDTYENEATRLVRQKEEEERQAQLARMREQQLREQARQRMSGPPSSGGFGGGGQSSGGSSWGGGGGKSGGNSSGGSKW